MLDSQELSLPATRAMTTMLRQFLEPMKAQRLYTLLSLKKPVGRLLNTSAERALEIPTIQLKTSHNLSSHL
jgi:hypothetical protein